MADTRTVVEGDLKNPKKNDPLATRIETSSGATLPKFRPTDRENTPDLRKNEKKTQIIPPDGAPSAVQPDRKLIGWLYSFSRISAGEFFVLREGRNRIGRDADNDIVLGAAASLPSFAPPTIEESSRTSFEKHDVEDLGISGKHCVIMHYPDDKTTFIQDCGSQNGTRVNGKCIRLNDCDVSDGDNIQIGKMKLTLKLINEACPPKVQASQKDPSHGLEESK